MAHGAPDHTRLSDDAFSHYTWKQKTPGALVLPFQTYGDLIDLSFIGVIGGWWARNNYSPIRYEVYVDEVLIHSFSASFIYTNQMWGVEFAHPFYGIGCYDIVNDKYVVWDNFNFMCYVHSRFKIKCFNPHAALAKQVSKSNLVYLEKM